ncbi:MAG TPA: glycoside hydrolase family 15 protein [Bdellovibrionales bacterium]|nr:glycoside hydrolase family 15 protein [Bdellovibrionales bacterium]
MTPFARLAWIFLSLFGLMFLTISYADAQSAIRQAPQPVWRAGDAPGGPGQLGHFPRPDKIAFGTTMTTPLWFTAVDGALSELYYPHVDRVQTQSSFLLIREGNRVIDERRGFSHHATRFPRSSAYHIRSAGDGVVINKIIQVSVPHHAAVIDYTVEFKSSAARELAFVHNPAAEGTPGGDTIQAEELRDVGRGLLAFQADVRGDEPEGMLPFSKQFVTWTLPVTSVNMGFEGVNSPFERPFDDANVYMRAQFGNVAGALYHKTTEARLRFRVVLAFSAEKDWQSHLAQQIKSLKAVPVETLIAQQQAQWSQYLNQLAYDKSDALLENSIIVLKSCEDKIVTGAFIAAPANPGIPWMWETVEQDYEKSRRRLEDTGNGGYHRVWPRDLYHKALALLAVGDVRTPLNVARWYKAVQLSSGKPGSWAQNMWVNGQPSWTGMQLDQVGFPIVLVGRLVELKAANYDEFRDMVNRAAEFIMRVGPWTEQERWEENGGLSPNSMAAAVEGLMAAAWLESARDQKRAQAYLNKAQEWTANLKAWTLIRQGAFGENYIARFELGHNGSWNPQHHSYFRIANKRPGQQDHYREDEILDGGFLQWILAGLVGPKDSEFSNTIRLYDQHVRRKTYAGLGYIRYNHDSYGENHVGGAWPLLSAERGIAAIERGEDFREHLLLMQNMSTSAHLIAEQDTLSVRPLAWSHGAYILFKKSIQDRRSFYIPRRNLR